MKFIQHASQIIVSAALILMIATSSYATPKPNNEPGPNLVEVEHKSFDKVLQIEGAALPNAKKVFIEPIPVTFDKRWEREHRSDVSSRYKEKTKERYSKLLKERLEKALQKNDAFVIVSNADEADIVLAPELVNLNILGPDDGFNKTYVYTAGYAALDLDIYDGKGNTLVAEVYDRRETRNSDLTRTQLATRVTNYRDFKHLMDKWGSYVTQYLTDLRQ